MRMLRAAAALIAVALAACTTQPVERESVVELATRKPEQRQLKLALEGKLFYPKDRVIAYKYLAFVYCASNRTSECSDAFRAALAIDPKFQLSATEGGHPIWGPVFKSRQAQPTAR